MKKIIIVSVILLALAACSVLPFLPQSKCDRYVRSIEEASQTCDLEKMALQGGYLSDYGIMATCTKGELNRLQTAFEQCGVWGAD